MTTSRLLKKAGSILEIIEKFDTLATLIQILSVCNVFDNVECRYF